MVPIHLHSEPYSPDGNLAADGAVRLLGQPALSPLELLLRETLQNSWDASLGCQGTPLFRIRIRRLEPDQQKAMRLFFRELPPAAADEPVSAGLRHFLDSPNPLVMEVCDEGTKGLGGPTRASETFPEGVQPDFVNFVRNIGSPRDMAFGGGTYGFGKSSLFRISRCGTVVIDTLTGDAEALERRLIAKAMGMAFDHAGRRHTGRHWWGIAAGSAGGSVEPVLGEKSTCLAGSLGFTPRSGPAQRGTSLMILDPVLEDLGDDLGDDPAGLQPGADEIPGRLMARIQEVLLWHGWPKFTARPGCEPPMRCRLSVLGRDSDLPDPATIMPLWLLTEALEKARSKTDPVFWHRATRIGFFGQHQASADLPADDRFRIHLGQKALIPGTLCHMALLRPAELVVRYEVGSVNKAEGTQGTQWGGVYICDTGDGNIIEQAYAQSEPPAHDDWQPRAAQQLDKRQKSYVTVGLTRIRNKVRELSGLDIRPVQPIAQQEQNSFAELAGEIGRALIGTGPGGSDGSRQPGAAGGSGRRVLRISTPQALGTTLRDGVPVATFRILVTGNTADEITINLNPWVQSDLTEKERLAPNGRAPEVVGVSIDDSPVDIPGPQVRCRPSAGRTELRVLVSVPDYVAVGLSVDLAESGDGS